MTTISLRSSVSQSASAKAETMAGRRVMMIRATGSADRGAITPADSAVIEAGFRTAREKRLPIVTVLSTSGAAVEYGVAAVDGWGRTARELVLASGVVPILMIAAGPVVSGPALLLGLADIAVFTDDAYAFVSGPHMVEAFTGVPISASQLGGASAHARSTGVAALSAPNEEVALELVASVLSFLPDHVDDLPHFDPPDDPIDRSTAEAGDVLPDHPTGSYDVRTVITDVADDGDFLEIRATWAPNLVTGFCRIGGYPVGLLANQTQSLAGSIDIPASHKGARFVSMCDAFNLPLVTMVDTSGFLPGKDLEWRGMIRHGAQLAFAYARATVPRIGLILRKSYGGAYIVMDSRFVGNDLMLAWPSAEVAVMGAKGAVEILHRRATPEERQRLEADYEEKYLTPYPTAARGSISAVIEPADTRRELAAALEVLSTKKEDLVPRRHDNIPL